MYGIVIGKNNNLNIDHITAKLMHENFSFTSDVFGEKVFVKFEKCQVKISQLSLLH
jgi:hypothetical protein